MNTDRNTHIKFRLKQLPTPVSHVHKKSIHEYMQLLTEILGQIDDTLFNLAEKAASNQQQDTYFDGMRDLRTHRKNILATLALSIDEAFYTLLITHAPAPQKVTVQEADTRTSNKIAHLALVENDALEAMLATETTASRLNFEFGNAIQQLSLRLDTLLPTKVYLKNNPFAPEKLCKDLFSAIEKLNLSIKIKLVIMKVFDRTMLASLGGFYNSLNQILIDHNILPSLGQQEPATTHYAQHTSQHRTPQNTPPLSHQQTNNEKASGDKSDMHIIAALAEYLGADGIDVDGNATDHSASDNNTSSLHNRRAVPYKTLSSNLLKLLSTAQKLPSNRQPIDTQALARLSEKLPEAQTDIPVRDSKIIELVAKLFEFILEDENLAAQMKALISRLQIPIVKVALMDKTFFSHKKNSARQLLDTMAEAALGWQVKNKNWQQDPLYQQMLTIVKTLLNDFTDNIDIFDALLSNFRTFIEKDTRRIKTVEKRTLSMEDGKAKCEAAKQKVSEVIAEILHSKGSSDTLFKLIEPSWQNILYINLTKYGQNSENWSACLRTLKDLVTLIHADTPEIPTEEKNLQNTALLNRIDNILDDIACDTFEKDMILRRFSNALQEKISPTPYIAPENHHAKPNGTQRQPINRAASLATKHTPAMKDNPFINQAQQLAIGSWLEMKTSDKKPFRCRLATYLKPTARYIFVNRDGMKVAEKTLEELALSLQKNELRLLDNSALFERALENVVSHLRKTRTSPAAQS